MLAKRLVCIEDFSLLYTCVVSDYLLVEVLFSYFALCLHMKHGKTFVHFDITLPCNIFVPFFLQSLLRGRFLRNGRSVDNERSASLAESELGLLRQRNTVSGLRYYLFIP